MKNSRNNPAMTPGEAKIALTRYYQGLQLEWSLELQNENTDWPHLFFLHYQIATVERRAPWLKKECQA